MNVIGATLALGALKDAASAASPFQLRYLGDPVLTTPCVAVNELSEIPAGLIAAMREACKPGSKLRSLPDPRSGMGLAANQVGALVRIILVQLEHDAEHTVMVNPVIETKPAMESLSEGCLSIPGFDVYTLRHRVLTVRFRELGWRSREVTCVGMAARCVQHELDHLDGKLITHGLSRQLRRQAERAVAKARGE